MWTPISTCAWIWPVLLGRQRAGLLEHAVVDADLADVVEQAHQVEVARAGWPTCPAPRPSRTAIRATRSEWPEVYGSLASIAAVRRG